VNRDVDRALAFASVAAVAIVPTIMMVGLSAGGGFSGGTAGGPIVPAAREVPGPGPDQIMTSPTSGPALQGPQAAWGRKQPGSGNATGAAGQGQPPKDTGGYRSFLRVTDRSLYWINGSGSYSDEKAKIVMSPFSFDATTVTKTTEQGRTTTDTTRVTVVGRTRTTVENGIQTDQRSLSDSQYADFVKSCDPKELTREVRSFPLLQHKPGLEILNLKRGPGPQGFETDTLNLTVGAVLPYLPKTIASQLDKPPINTEGFSGYLVADKWDRPWALGVSRIALPLGMADLGILFLGYQK
jgi:hypothetical protein